MFLPVVLVVLALAVTASAHHSFSRAYTGQLVRLEGKVVEVDIRNPHSFINFEVTDRNGKTTRWAAEWVSASQLKDDGVTKSLLKAGDKIVVEGATGREPREHKVLIRSIVRPAAEDAPEFKWAGRVQ
jgi:hypothetical protein